MQDFLFAKYFFSHVPTPFTHCLKHGLILPTETSYKRNNPFVITRLKAIPDTIFPYNLGYFTALRAYEQDGLTCCQGIIKLGRNPKPKHAFR